MRTIDAYPSELQRIEALDLIHRTAMGRALLHELSAHALRLRRLSAPDEDARDRRWHWRQDGTLGSESMSPEIVDLAKVPAVAKALKTRLRALETAKTILMREQEALQQAVKQALSAKQLKLLYPQSAICGINYPSFDRYSGSDATSPILAIPNTPTVPNAKELAQASFLRMVALVNTTWLEVEAEGALKAKKALVEKLRAALRAEMDSTAAALGGAPAQKAPTSNGPAAE